MTCAVGEVVTIQATFESLESLILVLMAVYLGNGGMVTLSRRTYWLRLS